jgi:predicted ester cyclase
MGRQAALRLYELLNQGDVESIGDLVDADFVEHDPLPGQGQGREGALDRFSMITGALAPHFAVEDVIAEGDKVVARNTVTGTHRGEFMGVAPTGKSVTYNEIFIFRFADGRVVETWGVVDVLAQMKQIGVVPA